MSTQSSKSQPFSRSLRHPGVRIRPTLGRTIIIVGSLSCLAGGLKARAQALSVLPVNVQMAPGQGASTLTVTNHGERETAIQIRVYGWDQKDGDDKLTDSDAVVVSPPIATLAPGASQVVRIVLRHRPELHEETYRILLDQIPPPAEPGAVHIVLRLSIPIFAQPSARALAHVSFRVEQHGDKTFLVATNDGAHHETLRDITLFTKDGNPVKPVMYTPYVLGGATRRRWPIEAKDIHLGSEPTLRMTAHADSGIIEQQVQVVSAP